MDTVGIVFEFYTESESESEIFIRSFQTQETSAKTITGRCRRGHLLIYPGLGLTTENL